MKKFVRGTIWIIAIVGVLCCAFFCYKGIESCIANPWIGFGLVITTMTLISFFVGSFVMLFGYTDVISKEMED